MHFQHYHEHLKLSADHHVLQVTHPMVGDRIVYATSRSVILAYNPKDDILPFEVFTPGDHGHKVRFASSLGDAMESAKNALAELTFQLNRKVAG